MRWSGRPMEFFAMPGSSFCRSSFRHCEARSDEAIQSHERRLDCFVASAPRNDGNNSRYFRTQITRTTDAFASAEAPFAALTPLVFRKARTMSALTKEACVDAAVMVGPATISGLSNAIPANTL